MSMCSFNSFSKYTWSPVHWNFYVPTVFFASASKFVLHFQNKKKHAMGQRSKRWLIGIFLCSRRSNQVLLFHLNPPPPHSAVKQAGLSAGCSSRPDSVQLVLSLSRTISSPNLSLLINGIGLFIKIKSQKPKWAQAKALTGPSQSPNIPLLWFCI